MGVWAQNIQTSHQEILKKISIFEISKIHLVIWQMLVKIKKQLLDVFDPVAAVFFIMMR